MNLLKNKELKRAYATKQPVAVALWSPHWAYSQYDLTRLKDDKDDLGTLESEIGTYGQGHEERAVAAWLKEHPERVGRMTPS